MSKAKIQFSCARCQGTGIYTPPEEQSITCPVCNGNKVFDYAFLNLTPTCVILEATDSDEYTALDANKKAWYDLFISAGFLDMSDGTKARDLFLAWIFPPRTKTYAALMAVL